MKRIKEGSPEVMAKNVSRIAWALSVALVSGFGWLALRGEQVLAVAKAVPPDLLYKLSLTLYFASWITGVPVDSELQAKAYLRAPNRGRIPIPGLGIMVLAAIVFAFICVAVSYSKFWYALVAFFAVDYCGWRYLIKTVRPAIVASRKEYLKSGQYAKAIKLDIIEDHVCGNWKWWRGLASFTILIVMGLLIFELAPIPLIASRELTISLAIFGYVVVMELWMWWVRFSTITSNKLIDNITDHYHLGPTN